MPLQEATYEMTAQAMDRQLNKDDEKLRVKFSLYPHFNQEASNKEGRPIFDQKTYVTIIVPGQQDIVHRVAWRADFERFPRQYAAFQNDQDQDTASGTPLKVVPWLQLNQVKELEYFNCHTVEQLASMPDSVAGKFMAINSLKQRAKDYLAAAEKAAPLVEMRAELEDRDAKIKLLQEQVAELLARKGK